MIIKLTKKLKVILIKALQIGELDTSNLPHEEIDISKFTEEEKQFLLKIARKYS